jgi:ABC-2 type transport system permease protein
MPVVLVILFGYAVTTDIKDAKIAVLDNSNDELTTGITNKLISSGYFIESVRLHSNKDLQEVFRNGKIKLAIVFADNFSESFYHDNKARVQLIADASDLNTATTLLNYASTIIQDYQKETVKAPEQKALFETTVKMLYNPEQKGVFMFVPGVLALILMLVSAMMTAVSLAREKESGTMRVLTVSPLRPLLIITGKVIPYLAISLINTFLILLLSVFIFGMPINGNIFLLFLVCLTFLFTAMSLGIMIAALSDTQQIALMISILGIFLPTVLLSGFIYPIENMPMILQVICQVSPGKWFIEAIKSVMIKGSGLSAIWLQLSVLIAMSILFVRISTAQFKKRAS